MSYHIFHGKRHTHRVKLEVRDFEGGVRQPLSEKKEPPRFSVRAVQTMAHANSKFTIPVYHGSDLLMALAKVQEWTGLKQPVDLMPRWLQQWAKEAALAYRESHPICE